MPNITFDHYYPGKDLSRPKKSTARSGAPSVAVPLMKTVMTTAAAALNLWNILKLVAWQRSVTMFYHLLSSRSPRPIYTKPKYGQPTCNNTTVAADHYWEISTGANPATLTLGNSYFSCCLLTLSAWLESIWDTLWKIKGSPVSFLRDLNFTHACVVLFELIRFHLLRMSRIIEDDAY